MRRHFRARATRSGRAPAPVCSSALVENVQPYLTFSTRGTNCAKRRHHARMYDAQQRAELANELAAAFLAEPWEATALAERGAGCLERWPSWLDALALHATALHLSPPGEGLATLVRLIEEFLAQRPAAPGTATAACAAGAPGEHEPPRILRTLGRRARGGSFPPGSDEANRPERRRWPVTSIDSVPALAERLELSPGQLAWLADVRSLERTVAVERLRNYRYRTAPRRGGLPRVIEVPKARLMEIQRWLLHEILDEIPAHDAAHGFTRGRSVITHARVHTGRDALLRLDLKDFFASISAGRVYGILRAAGYADAVAHVLTGLCTNTVPAHVWQAVKAMQEQPQLLEERFWFGRLLATPTSRRAPRPHRRWRTSRRSGSTVASAASRQRAVSATHATPMTSRSPDPRGCSAVPRGSPRSSRRSFARRLALHPRKSALRSAAARQSVCGVVVNVRPNVARAEYDRLRASLHNAARHGPESQNRTGVPDLEAHLRGRIAGSRR